MPAEEIVCHVNLARGFRGGERQTELLMRELAVLGWQQRLVARKSAALADRAADIPRLQVVEVAANPLAAGLATRGCKLVHAHEARAIYAGLLGRWLYRIPYLATRRVTNPFKSSRLRDLAYRRAECIVALSRSIAAGITQHYPATHCPVIPSAHANLAEKHQRNPALGERYRDKIVIGHIGALVKRHKGQHNIVEVARRWQQSHPQVIFMLVGSGSDEAELKAAAAGLANIEFSGQVSNVDDYLELFDIFVFPSLMEGLGSILLDAMCFGLPIVASKVDGIPDIIEDGVNGLLVAPNDPDQLASALEQLLADQLAQQTMRINNIEKSKSYSAAAMASAYNTLYRKILDTTN